MLQVRKLMTASDSDGEEDEDGNSAPSSLQKLLDEGTEKMFGVIQAAKKQLGIAKKGKKRGEEDVVKLGGDVATSVSRAVTLISRAMTQVDLRAVAIGFWAAGGV